MLLEDIVLNASEARYFHKAMVLPDSFQFEVVAAIGELQVQMQTLPGVEFMGDNVVAKSKNTHK